MHMGATVGQRVSASPSLRYEGEGLRALISRCFLLRSWGPRGAQCIRRSRQVLRVRWDFVTVSQEQGTGIYMRLTGNWRQMTVHQGRGVLGGWGERRSGSCEGVSLALGGSSEGL